MTISSQSIRGDIHLPILSNDILEFGMTIEAASLAVSESEQDQNECLHENRSQTLGPEPELEREVDFDSESDESTLSLDDDPTGLLWDSGSKRQNATSLDESEVVAGSVEASTNHIYRGLTVVHLTTADERQTAVQIPLDGFDLRKTSVSLAMYIDTPGVQRAPELEVTASEWDSQLPFRSHHKIDEPGRLHCDFGISHTSALTSPLGVFASCEHSCDD